VQEPSIRISDRSSVTSDQKKAPAHSCTRSAHNRESRPRIRQRGTPANPHARPSTPLNAFAVIAGDPLRGNRPVRHRNHGAPRDAPEPDSHLQRTQRP